MSSIEICAGAGGQALGLEHAGFEHAAAFELDRWAYETLMLNRPSWNPQQADIREVRGAQYKGIDLFAGGVPCPPFSVAGRQLGPEDERDLFPAALEWVAECKPRAVMLENVPGLASPKFADYRASLFRRLRRLGFAFVDGRVLNASDFGVCQLRPRYVIVALRSPFADYFDWPAHRPATASVGDLLHDLMGQRRWPGVQRWRDSARGVAPTLVGGSKLHGGPDLGPTRAKQAWRQIGVDGSGLADEVPSESHPVTHIPKLTLRMTARIQGFPDQWSFAGRKTAAYRQVGNAFPPMVASAVGKSIALALAGLAGKPAEQRALFSAGAG